MCCSGQRPSCRATYHAAMLWLIVGVIVTSGVVPFCLSRWAYRQDDMGSVSGQWLAEYRQDHES